MPGDPAALKAELQKPEYAGLTDQQAADALNAAVKVRYAAKVPIGVIQQAAVDRGKLTAIQAAAQTNPYAGMTYWLWSSSRNDYPPINLQDAQFQANLEGLVSANLLSAEDKDYILDLSAIETTKARQVVGWEIPATATDIHNVRAN